MQKILRTVRDVVDLFEGPTELARWASIKTSAVCNWVDRGEIPPGWHLRLAIEANRRGATIHHTVFGLTDDEAKELPKAFAVHADGAPA